MRDETLARRFKRWFWRPPRPHGEVIAGRTVSVLELFYDLVYVAVIGQAGDQLAGEVSVRGFLQFAVVFALIWIAWMNGTVYLELHGRDDGRTRFLVFVQMGLLVLLAVFTAHAADGTGRSFAIVYALFLGFVAWLWYSVRRQDRHERPEFLGAGGRYLIGTIAAAVAVLVSAFLPAEARVVVWAGVAVGWIATFVWIACSSSTLSRAMPPTDSLVERLGLFTIIVLGEVVLGVVEGLSASERDARTIVTGMVALTVGFGFWWIYFDLVGGRAPRDDGRAMVGWLLSHLPITLSITAAGAAMVSLITHADDARTPSGTSWLLSGTVAIGLLALIGTTRTLADAERLDVVYRSLPVGLAVGGGAALVVGWARPVPWLLALLLVAILSAIWCFAVSRFLRLDAWGEEPSAPA
jgi:low temperature requirement protein LtrA